MAEITFTFENAEFVPIEGVAVLYAYDADGNPVVLYGDYGDPTALAAIGLHTVALDANMDTFKDGGEYEGA